MTDFVYLIHDDYSKAYKIGVSSNPEARLANLQTASARGKLTLVTVIEGSYDLEEYLHTTFSKYRLNGEWFEESEEILRYFENKIPATIVHSDFKLSMKNTYKHRTKIAYFLKENPVLIQGFKSESRLKGREVFLSYNGNSEYNHMRSIYDYLLLSISSSLGIDNIKYKNLTQCILTGLNFIDYYKKNNEN